MCRYSELESAGVALILTDRGRVTNAEIQGQFLMSEELIELLRQRVSARYYDEPQVIDVIARAILNSRGLYPN